MTPVCTLTAAEIEALRADMAEAGAAMRAELARREAEKAGQPPANHATDVPPAG
jgi:hypothetical protein